MNAKAVRSLLAKNPHPHRYTLGMFYREKMRALARIIPDGEYARVLDVGGGRSSLCHLLFPEARITNCDADPSLVEIWPWVQMPVELVHGRAEALPFEDASFDCVTGFDVLEHVPEDGKAAAEMVRVLRPGGYIFVSTPTVHFRHPFYSPFKTICRPEKEIFAEWGHVRRGYTREQVLSLFPECEPIGFSDYLNPLTVVAHDIAFSRLPERLRVAMIALQYPLTLAGYALGGPRPRLNQAFAFRRTA
ncbi:MAG: class I SAM-dependent methyltransferase [Armatimonadota bacterium]